MIYFIQDTVTNAIKIGFSDDPLARLRGLQTGNPHELVILGIIEGDKKKEADLHSRFKDFSIRGEWFSGIIAGDLGCLICGPGGRTIGEECRKRNDCRYGLAGVEIVVIGYGEFVVIHSSWAADMTLMLTVTNTRSFGVGFSSRPICPFRARRKANSPLENEQMTDRFLTALDFLDYARDLGIKIWPRADGKLMVDPSSKLRPGDADFIREHKAELMDALSVKTCCGVCPGVLHEACAGCPSPNIEIMYHGGLIAPQWCSKGIDAIATHWRVRGGTWNKVGEE